MAEAPRASRFTATVGSASQVVEVADLPDGRRRVTIDGRPHLVEAGHAGGRWQLRVGSIAAEATVTAAGSAYTVEVGGQTHRLQLAPAHRVRPGTGGDGDRELRAAMPGKVTAVLVREGDAVTLNQHLLVIEAMKLENDILAPRSGTVEKLRVRPGQAVESGELLAVIAGGPGS